MKLGNIVVLTEPFEVVVIGVKDLDFAVIAKQFS